MTIELRSPESLTVPSFATRTLTIPPGLFTPGDDVIYMATIAALKLLDGADRQDGEPIFLMGGAGARDGRQGWVIYDASSSATGDDVVVFAPADGVGRFIRQEWYERNELYAAWWGFVLNSIGAQAANGALIEDMFDFMQAQSESGTAFFQHGIHYIEMADAYVFTKIRGWTFQGVGDAGVAATAGTRFFLRGGGMEWFMQWRTVIQFHVNDIYMIIQGSGMDGILDMGAAPYYDAADTDQNGSPAPDSAAVSSFLNTFNRSTFTADWGAGFEPVVALVWMHSAVSIQMNDCWFVGANTAMKWGAEGAAHADEDGRMLAKGSLGQAMFSNCLIYGDVLTVRYSEMSVRAGQFVKPSGVSAPARGPRIIEDPACDVAHGLLFSGVGIAEGDRSDVFIRSEILEGLTMDAACVVGKFTYVAEADGSCDNWDVSPTLNVVAGAEPATGIIEILPTCTGKRIESRTPFDPLLSYIINDQRFSLLNTGRVSRKNYLRNGDFRLCFGATSASPASGERVLEAWRHTFNGTGATRTASQQTWSVGSEPDSGSPSRFRYVKTVAGTGATADDIFQRNPGVAQLSGKYVVISFIAVATGSITITPYVSQEFGSGGSASVVTFFPSMAITTTAKRHMGIVLIPSISGKTVGAGDVLLFGVRFPINATHSCDLGDMKLEEGVIPSPFIPRNESDAVVEMLPFSEKICGNSTQEPFGHGYNISTTHAHVFLNYFRKAGDPTITFPGTIASDYILQDSASATAVPSAIAATANRVGRRMAQIDVTSTGLTADKPVQLRAVAATGYAIVRYDP